MSFINYGDFAKLDIRVGAIVSVDTVESSNKLLLLKVDMGQEVRQILSGIAKYYKDFDELIGAQVLVVVNLKPRVMAGLESQGMILMVDSDARPVRIAPVEFVENGVKVE